MHIPLKSSPWFLFLVSSFQSFSESKLQTPSMLCIRIYGHVQGSRISGYQHFAVTALSHNLFLNHHCFSPGKLSAILDMCVLPFNAFQRLQLLPLTSHVLQPPTLAELKPKDTGRCHPHLFFSVISCKVLLGSDEWTESL